MQFDVLPNLIISVVMDMFFPQFPTPSIIWVPCIPDYSKGTFTPVYNLENIPANISEKMNVPPRGGIKTKPWKHEEDEKLKELVNEFGIKKWAHIANVLNEEFGTSRKGKNCRERWNNHLDPNINKGEWTYEEDLLLLTRHKAIGRRWSTISKELVGRTENSVKNRWNTLMKSFTQSVGSSNQDFASDFLISHLSSVMAEKKDS